MVAELKHATYFDTIGLPLEPAFAVDIASWATPSNLIVECFEQAALSNVQELDVPGRVTFLADVDGSPADQVARFGDKAKTFADYLTDAGLARLAAEVDGVSVDKALLFETDAGGCRHRHDRPDRARQVDGSRDLHLDAPRRKPVSRARFPSRIPQA